MMRVMMMMLMMMISAASARKLLFGPSESGFDCGNVVICMPEELTGGKTIRTFTTIYNGQPSIKWGHLAHRKAYCGAYGQIGNGIDVVVEFFLDDVLVHKGRYQQNHCILQAGAVTTDDPNAEFTEGSWFGVYPGEVRIRALGAVVIVNNCKHDITMTRAHFEKSDGSWYFMCDKNENIIKLEKDSQKFVMFTGMSFFTLGGIPTEPGEDVFILDNQNKIKFSQATYDDELMQFLPVNTYDELRVRTTMNGEAVNCEPYTESIFFNSYMIGYDNEFRMRYELLPANTPARVGLRYLKLCGA